MIAGGNATLQVSDLNRALRFYVETLGFKLLVRASDQGVALASWAEVDAGGGFVLVLHRAESSVSPAPGAPGSIRIELEVNQPIADVLAVLANRGVKFSGPVREEAGVKIACFSDPDENALYLAERIPAG